MTSRFSGNQLLDFLESPSSVLSSLTSCVLWKMMPQSFLKQLQRTSMAMTTYILVALLRLNLAISLNIQDSVVHPIVFIPALEGCRINAGRSIANYKCLQTTKDPKTLWFEPMFLGSLGCFMDTFVLNYDRNTHTTYSNEGVKISIPYFGETMGVELLNDVVTDSDMIVMKPLVDYFVSKGKYQRGINLRSAPYDFRKAPNELDDYFVQLKTLIEETSFRQKSRVILMTFCYGGTVSLYFLHRQSQEWKDKYIHNFVSIGAPYGGSMKPISGYTDGTEDLDRFPVLYRKRMIKSIATIPTLASMLPNKFSWTQNETLVDGVKGRFTTANMGKLFDLLGFPDIKLMFNDTKDLLGNLEHPGVNITCLYSTGLNTKSAAHFDREEDFPLNPRWTFEDGDRTVPTRSLQTCLRWSKNPSFTFTHQVFKKIVHFEMVKTPSFIEYLYNTITGDPF